MLMAVRGVRLHVAQLGASDAPPLLFMHGGPGAGSYDFLAFQGERLARDLRLIAVDQRGVQHSDPLDGPVTEDDLIADHEAVREALGIDRWTVLGHSYGGRLALKYAAKHPESVTRVVFENPAWDIALSTESLIRAALPILRDLGLEDRAIDVLSRTEPGFWNERIALIGALGERRGELYLGPDSRDLVLPADSLPEEIRTRGTGFHLAITGTPGFYESALPLLAGLTQPVLLIKGEHDPVTSDAEIAAFERDVPHGRYERFGDAGHLVHAEQPDAFARLVTEFTA